MRTILFSRHFPVKHPKAGEPTFFVEKIVRGLHKQGIKPFNVYCEFSTEAYHIVEPKHHTIRAGSRWRVGDWFSPRVWGDDINPKSGKSGPYHSKQIEFAPPIQIKKIWTFEMDEHGYYFINGKHEGFDMYDVALNDGLEKHDFDSWFNIHPKKQKSFSGQILCWNENIEY